VTVKAEHLPLSPAQKEAARELVEGLKVEPEGELEILLTKARRALLEREEGLERLSRVVAELEAAIHEGREQDQENLAEELADILYELDEE